MEEDQQCEQEDDNYSDSIEPINFIEEKIDFFSLNKIYFLKKEDLINRYANKIQDLAKQFNSENRAIKFLEQYQWQIQCADDQESIKVYNEMPANFTDQHSNSAKCLVCQDFDFKNQNDYFQLDCGHRICFHCIKIHFQVQMQSTQFSSFIRCPSQGCKVLLSKEIYKQLSSALGIPNQYDQILFNQILYNDKNIMECPACNTIIVGQYVSHNLKQTAINLQCQCQYIFCSLCRSEAHFPLSCDEFQKWKLRWQTNEEQLSVSYIQQYAKQCPKCHEAYEKDEHCLHMTCLNPICKFEFCWLCEEPWYVNHVNVSKCYLDSENRMKCPFCNRLVMRATQQAKKMCEFCKVEFCQYCLQKFCINSDHPTNQVCLIKKDKEQLEFRKKYDDFKKNYCQKKYEKYMASKRSFLSQTSKIQEQFEQINKNCSNQSQYLNNVQIQEVLQFIQKAYQLLANACLYSYKFDGLPLQLIQHQTKEKEGVLQKFQDQITNESKEKFLDFQEKFDNSLFHQYKVRIKDKQIVIEEDILRFINELQSDTLNTQFKVLTGDDQKMLQLKQIQDNANEGYCKKCLGKIENKNQLNLCIKHYSEMNNKLYSKFGIDIYDGLFEELKNFQEIKKFIDDIEEEECILNQKLQYLK